MFFVNELFRDDKKFDKFMRKLERGYSTSSLNSSSLIDSSSVVSESLKDSSSEAEEEGEVI